LEKEIKIREPQKEGGPGFSKGERRLRWEKRKVKHRGFVSPANKARPAFLKRGTAMRKRLNPPEGSRRKDPLGSKVAGLKKAGHFGGGGWGPAEKHSVKERLNRLNGTESIKKKGKNRDKTKKG